MLCSCKRSSSSNLWRSEKMNLINLFIPVEAVHETVDELGLLGMIQFCDLNKDVNMFQRHFVQEVKQADEMDRKLRFLEAQVSKEFKVEETHALDQVDVHDPDEEMQKMMKSDNIDELGAYLEDIEKELADLNANQDLMRHNYNELVEFEHVLMKDSQFFAKEGVASASDITDEGDISDEEQGSSKPKKIEEEEREEDEESDTTHKSRDLEKSSTASIDSIVGAADVQRMTRLGFLTGVIKRSAITYFERVLWRATRGNLYMKNAEIEEDFEDPQKPGEFVPRNAFIIFYQGQRARERIRKICELYGAHLYPCPDSSHERDHLVKQVTARLEELATVMQKTAMQRRNLLAKIAPTLQRWSDKLLHEKGIYHTINMFEYHEGRNTFIAEGWCPVEAMEDIQQALHRATAKSGAGTESIVNIVDAHKAEPPTYYKTNKFTRGFQAIVNAYGTPRYGELNPTPLTVITFPFLFGIMFGDVGHGLILLLFALVMIIWEKKLEASNINEGALILFNGRYVILLMALFSIYCGSLYNEYFSIPVAFWGSTWNDPEGDDDQLRWSNPEIAYPYGVDPEWRYKGNELTFYNSLKMKISVIFGVSQMTVGIIISLFNAIHFRQPYNIFFEFIPQILFMESIFGYMCLLVWIKWCTDYLPDPHDAPQLLNMLIDMFLKPFNDIDGQLFDGQKYVQWVLILVAVASIPVMLFVKPILLCCDHRRKKKRAIHHLMKEERDLEAGRKRKQKAKAHKKKKSEKGKEKDSDGSDEESGLQLKKMKKGKEGKEDSNSSDSTNSSEEVEKHHHKKHHKKKHHEELKEEPEKEEGGSSSSDKSEEEHEEEEFDFTEIFVHQVIHTIEFVLGSVSNTASYLRLWALSLAHSELSNVFWDHVMVECLKSGIFVLIFIAFALWAVFTLGVLLAMECLSAFLHALRLHWVEFQNKFYYGDGYLFEPFSYERLLAAKREEKRTPK